VSSFGRRRRSPASSAFPLREWQRHQLPGGCPEPGRDAGGGVWRGVAPGHDVARPDEGPLGGPSGLDRAHRDRTTIATRSCCGVTASGPPTRSSWQGCWRRLARCRTSLLGAAMLDDPPTLEQESDALSASRAARSTDQLHLSSAYVELDCFSQSVPSSSVRRTATTSARATVSVAAATRCDPRRLRRPSTSS